MICSGVDRCMCIFGFLCAYFGQQMRAVPNTKRSTTQMSYLSRPWRIVMTVRRALCLYAMVALLAALNWAQEPVKPPVSPRVMTATRQVTVFSALELQMLQPIQNNDNPPLQSM